TTVVEVGVDVPAATMMVIDGADRFGLAQLHQLRGRVGRGTVESFCVLVSDSTDEVAQARLHAVADTHDGFELAEEDLELRGGGEGGWGRAGPGRLSAPQDRLAADRRAQGSGGAGSGAGRDAARRGRPHGSATTGPGERARQRLAPAGRGR